MGHLRRAFMCFKVRGFFFFIFKKIKISKIYVRFGKFQKYTPVALWGRRDRAQMQFFFQICNEVPGVKKGGGLSPPQRATGGACRPPLRRPLGPAHGRGRGACRPPPVRATGVLPPIKAPALPFPPHLSPKIPPKIQKKREG